MCVCICRHNDVESPPEWQVVDLQRESYTVFRVFKCFNAYSYSICFCSMLKHCMPTVIERLAGTPSADLSQCRHIHGYRAVCNGQLKPLTHSVSYLCSMWKLPINSTRGQQRPSSKCNVASVSLQH